MEGNDCYKFSTIENYIQQTSGKPIELAIDIGCNLGMVTKMIRQYFAGATIFAFEAVEEYYLAARKHLRDDPHVHIFHAAASAEHVYADDLGADRRPAPVPLQIFKGTPRGGVGWVGGSMVTTRGGNLGPDHHKYDPLCDPVPAVTFDEIVNIAMTLTNSPEVDYVKLDCELCENAVLGCARRDTLQNVRFLSGEYHDLDRFYEVVKHRLNVTHRVHLSGGSWGAFFAERKGSAISVLDPTTMLSTTQPSRISQRTIRWHAFRDTYVLPHEREIHGL